MGKEKLIYIPLLIGARNDIAEKIRKSGLRIGYGGGRVPWRFPTNNEDYGMSDGDDYGLKVCAYPFVRNGS